MNVIALHGFLGHANQQVCEEFTRNEKDMVIMVIHVHNIRIVVLPSI